ncbi:hypothetical protein F4781DRAFT_435039 [Annulohypoxylon bovei var. microspora]|nr:hypothetical protein F4781DRAFT_435039 [Annulohypoxylon bovei var. microspora]
MAPDWQNQSCDPFTPSSSACDIGNYVDFTVNVSSPSGVAAGLQFAQKHNIKIVIKNTGHDSAYTGPAVKMGGELTGVQAGAQAFEMYTAADAAGLRVVGEACTTVGLAGGFLQGVGHSTLSSTYGMGADQILEWEVVSANGTHLVASPFENEDLC